MMKYIELFFQRNLDYIKHSDVPHISLKNTPIYYLNLYLKFGEELDLGFMNMALCSL